MHVLFAPHEQLTLSAVRETSHFWHSGFPVVKPKGQVKKNMWNSLNDCFSGILMHELIFFAVVPGLWKAEKRFSIFWNRKSNIP